jgi:peptidoglycan/LPS O-acetylase OafA/YrhL
MEYRPKGFAALTAGAAAKRVGCLPPFCLVCGMLSALVPGSLTCRSSSPVFGFLACAPIILLLLIAFSGNWGDCGRRQLVALSPAQALEKIAHSLERPSRPPKG